MDYVGKKSNKKSTKSVCKKAKPNSPRCGSPVSSVSLKGKKRSAMRKNSIDKIRQRSSFVMKRHSYSKSSSPRARVKASKDSKSFQKSKRGSMSSFGSKNQSIFELEDNI